VPSIEDENGILSLNEKNSLQKMKVLQFLREQGDVGREEWIPWIKGIFF
jgi:hypothetical protein